MLRMSQLTSTGARRCSLSAVKTPLRSIVNSLSAVSDTLIVANAISFVIRRCDAAAAERILLLDSDAR